MPLTVERSLLVPAQRWGWQYVDPGAPRSSALRERPPVYRDPPPPNTLDLDHRIAQGRSKLGKRIAIVVVALLTFGGLGDGGGLLVPLALAAFFFGPMLLAKRQLDARHAEWQATRQVEQARHEQATRDWQQAIRREEQQVWSRIQAAPVWYPVQFTAATDRIDVFGGAPYGWPHLIATFGAAAVAGEASLLVVDLTEHDVAAGLMDIAAARAPVTGMQLPRDADKLDLLDGLDAEEIAEVFAEALETRRGSPDPGLRALDAEVLLSIAQRLDGQITAARLAAGVRVLQRIREPEGLLTLDELASVTRLVDEVGSSDRTQDELRFVHGALQLLARGADGQVARPVVKLLADRPGVTVVATCDGNQRRKDFVDRVLFHAILQRLRSVTFASRGQVLVIAGADHLGATSLEALARQAVRRGVRLVYLFEHLRDETRRLLGSSQSATLIMRLGNTDEAAAAAEYIGRGHTMQLSQISKQNGMTYTHGGGTTSGFSTTTTDGTTDTAASQGGSSSRSYSTAINSSLQTMSNWSEASSTNDGVTHQRTYEFSVEPTAIQSLPATAFILVEGGAAGRRAVVADCNPAIAMLDRVAPAPLPAGRS